MAKSGLKTIPMVGPPSLSFCATDQKNKPEKIKYSLFFECAPFSTFKPIKLTLIFTRTYENINFL
jgi:hypothetical protein